MSDDFRRLIEEIEAEAKAEGTEVELCEMRREFDSDGPGLTLEPPITPMAELDAVRGTKPASAEDFERFAADIPYDEG